MPRRGGGRGRSQGNDGKRKPGRPPMDHVAGRVHTITLPVSESDENIVQCSECDMSCTFREFRLHNIEAHYNIAKSMEDPSPLDHKYFTRKLLEMARLTKITTFFCPRKPCDATYKSALGLAFHLDTCGKSAEERVASLITCDLCHKKYTAANMSWHKRHSHINPPPEVAVPYPVDDDRLALPTGKRKSAVKALEFMKEISDVNVKVEAVEDGDTRQYARWNRDDRDADFALPAHYVKKEYDDEEDAERDENMEVTPSVSFILGSEEVKLPSKRQRATPGPIGSLRPDFCVQASKYLETHPEVDTDDPWDTPLRVTIDPLRSVLPRINSLIPIHSASQILQYLPLHEQSIQFNTKFKQGKAPREFSRLNWFESQVIDPRKNDFVAFAGGPITSMAWHPSGRYLALSTLRDVNDTPNSRESGSRLSSIQIYGHGPKQEGGALFSLLLILGSTFGYVNHLQWSAFCPSVHDAGEDFRIAYLCAAFEDSTCRVFALRQSDFMQIPTFPSQVNLPNNLPVYTKVPEITLFIDEEAQSSSGQCMCFDWDEASRYLVAGYGSSYVAVYNLTTTSELLRTVTEDDDNFKVDINPLWLITCHFSPVTAVVIDPKSSRYFYTGSMDRTLRSWDMALRQETECKKVGCLIDMCWIRGWVHLGVTVDAAVSNPGSQYNFLRFYTVGNSVSRPNVVEYFNITSTSFFEGMVLCGGESGRVTISYYDAFWRECDYDRNKKKKNFINIGRVILDPSAYEPVPFALCDEDIRPFPEGEEPRVTFSYCRDRCQGSQEPEPSREEVENVYRFYKYIRVNKVCWAPNGKYITIGYRNGLFAVISADFDKLFI